MEFDTRIVNEIPALETVFSLRFQRLGREFVWLVLGEGLTALGGFGPGWPNGLVPEDEMIEVYARSRINLGFSGVGYSMKETCLKGRDFEVPMSGALYLTTEQPDLHRVYDVGWEVAAYRSKADCLQKIRYLLPHPQQCEEIRRSARERCLREHTWERRFRELFKLIGLLDE